MARPAVAIVHDYLTQRGGAERVVLAMARAFPDAEIHTSLYDPDATFAEFADYTVHTMAINRVGALRRDHRRALPLLATAFSRTTIDADLAICSSSGWAHGAAVTGTKLVYCHAPARWLYQQDTYLAGAGPAKRAAVRAMTPALERWDARAARSADRYLANSTHTRQMVADAYGIDAEVLHPPAGLDHDTPPEPVDGIEPGHVLVVSRLLPYKNVAAIVAAMDRLGSERLVIVGSGPDEARLKGLAGSNVTFLAEVSDGELAWLYANAAALVAASYEDFGLTPLEAAAAGVPTVALRFGGFLDTVIDGTTGIFFDEPEPAQIADAIICLRSTPWAAPRIRQHAGAFAESRFAASLHALGDQVAETRR